MSTARSTKARKRKLTKKTGVSEPVPELSRSPTSSTVTQLSPSLLLLEIPPDVNTSLPVWDAVRSQRVSIAWTVNPYGINLHLTPLTSEGQGQKKKKAAVGGTSGKIESGTQQEPQMLVQPTAQQNTPQILLTFSNVCTQSLPAHTGQPNPSHLNATTSVVVSLPVIITQPPSPTHNPPLLSLTPASTPIKQRVASAPPSYHTLNAPDVLICDRFLLGQCDDGRGCLMHHTPLPFHWQLWSLAAQKWVDVQPSTQVTLERLYCDVEKEEVYLRDGYNIIFRTMELDDLSKYAGVRRLTNSDSPVRNPYFPSKFKIYWWHHHHSWEEYDKTVSPLLQMSMSKKEPTCSFIAAGQRYKVDFTTMIQTNLITGFEREVRCRPVYRSPDSMQPHLQTGFQTDSVSEPPGANFSVDPLEEFSSWYPPVWSLSSGHDYSLVDVPAGTLAHRKVRELFFTSLPETKVDIVSIQQVQNLLHWDKYQRQKAYMQKKQLPKSKDPLERHLFHGTTREAAENICHNNFDPRLAGVNGTCHGFGSYFASKASLSSQFSSKNSSDKVCHMFLAKVLVGKACLGKSNYRRPPPLRKRAHCLYDACVDSMDQPTMFVVYDRCQCYPYYLIKYQDLPEQIDI